MNASHWHLLLNHAPLFGIVFGLLVLILGYWRKSDDMKFAAVLVLLIASIMIFPVHQTGDAAEHTVEEIAGVNKADIEEHEEAAQFALYTCILLGLASIAALVQYQRHRTMPKGLTMAVLLIAAFSFTVIARTAFLGGYIRHTEIHSGTPPGTTGQDDEH